MAICYDKIGSVFQEKDNDNSIEALEYSGEMLERVSDVFFNLYSADTNDDMDTIAEKVSPLLSDHSDNITLNAALLFLISSFFITFLRSLPYLQKVVIQLAGYDAYASNTNVLNVRR